MALVSAANMLRSISLFHLTIAYFLLVSPTVIVNQNLVFILGEAMNLAAPSSTFSIPSPPLAFLSAVLTLLGISDLTAVSLPQEVFSYYWSSQAPIRLFFFFVVTGYSYAFQPGGPMRVGEKPGWDGLNNSVVFTWGFVEMLIWFWIFTTLREERQVLATQIQERRNAENNML